MNDGESIAKIENIHSTYEEYNIDWVVFAFTIDIECGTLQWNVKCTVVR